MSKKKETYELLGLEKETCKKCGSHLSKTDGGKLICLNACHLGEAGQSRFAEVMRKNGRSFEAKQRGLHTGGLGTIIFGEVTGSGTITVEEVLNAPQVSLSLSTPAKEGKVVQFDVAGAKKLIEALQQFVHFADRNLLREPMKVNGP